MPARQPEQAARATWPLQAADRPPLADREAQNPYFRWIVHVGAPLSASLLIHATLFALLALKSWEVFGARQRDAGAYTVGIRDARGGAQTGETFDWGDAPGLQLADAARSSATERIQFGGFSDLRELERRAAAAPGESGSGGFGLGQGGRADILGIGSGAGSSGGGAGIGTGFGSGAGIGRAGVWSVTAAGERFAYVVDFSGSIIVAVGDLKRELKRSIGMLSADQSFNVFVFYSTSDQRREHFQTESFAAKMRPATADAKREFFAWIDRKTPMGSTEPLQAMKRALALRPDAVFLFSDGYFDDEVVEEVAGANRNAGAQIHCLVFDELLLQDLSGLPQLTDGARRLKRIAEDSGGKLKIVTGADLRP